MLINSYGFGSIVVDGVDYDSDLIIHLEALLPGWRRAAGHHLTLQDLEWVLARRPKVLLIGQGYFGRMKVPDSVRTALSSLGLEVEAARTGAAVKRFNQLAENGVDVAGAFHLTC